ncbi:hypothetical protein E2C01_015574 [Portunus trituberculatus]|uniref:Uncharacterized protein n=1 Tax=Portunus trituberculatus TaxID=210409 RepID=A0A5B7DNM0_PORTR|nr:hypothetical protein [Portunus trituberculatus]
MTALDSSRRKTADLITPKTKLSLRPHHGTNHLALFHTRHIPNTDTRHRQLPTPAICAPRWQCGLSLHRQREVNSGSSTRVCQPRLLHLLLHLPALHVR